MTTIIEPLSAAIAADAGVAAVAAAEVDPAAGVATIVVVPDSSPQDAATFETVQRLRSDVFPAVLADSPATAHVGAKVQTHSSGGSPYPVPPSATPVSRSSDAATQSWRRWKPISTPIVLTARMYR